MPAKTHKTVLMILRVLEHSVTQTHCRVSSRYVGHFPIRIDSCLPDVLTYWP